MKRVPALIAVVWAALLITVLELYALSQGVDGMLFSLSIGAIMTVVAGFAGFRIGKR